MKPLRIKPCSLIRGTAIVPGDKSISHRAAILSAFCRGRTEIRNFLFSGDSLTTLSVLRQLGVTIRIDRAKNRVVVDSQGRFFEPAGPLHMNESGTSARVLLGLLAAQPFASRITASPSLLKRPMARVIRPLREMGALIRARQRGDQLFLPLRVEPAALRGISWKQRVASAQVKSAILLAGLFAAGRTCVFEKQLTRDHTERMLKLFGAHIHQNNGKTCVEAENCLVSPGSLEIPADISSAIFFVVAALLLKGSSLLVRNVGVNPTRLGALRVLRRMGGRITVTNHGRGYEPVACLRVSSSSLKAVRIRSAEIASLIDELPILMVACSLAKGKSVMEGVGELRHKETDRILSMVTNLRKMGARIETKTHQGREDIIIRGVERLSGAACESFGDHRTAMSAYVASLAACGSSSLDNTACVHKSFPGFFREFKHLIVR